jgi:hypothetical protein
MKKIAIINGKAQTIANSARMLDGRNNMGEYIRQMEEGYKTLKKDPIAALGVAIRYN